MNRVKDFTTFINESKGVAPVIYAPLKKYINSKGEDASYEEAKKHIADEVEGWDLSKEDFDEVMDECAM